MQGRRRNFVEPPIKRRTPRADFLVQSRNLSFNKPVSLSTKPSADYDNSFRRIQARLKSGKTESNNDVDALRNDLSIFLSSIVRSSNLDSNQSEIINKAVKLIHVFTASADDPLAYERFDLPSIMTAAEIPAYWKVLFIWIFANWDRLPVDIKIQGKSNPERTPQNPILEYVPQVFKGEASLVPANISDLLTLGKTKVFLPQFVAIVPVNTLIDYESGYVISSSASKEASFSELMGTKKLGYVRERKRLLETEKPEIESNLLQFEFDMNRPFQISEIRSILQEADPIEAARGISETIKREQSVKQAEATTGVTGRKVKHVPPPEGEEQGEIEEPPLAPSSRIAEISRILKVPMENIINEPIDTLERLVVAKFESIDRDIELKSKKADAAKQIEKEARRRKKMIEADIVAAKKARDDAEIARKQAEAITQKDIIDQSMLYINQIITESDKVRQDREDLVASVLKEKTEREAMEKAARKAAKKVAKEAREAREAAEQARDDLLHAASDVIDDIGEQMSAYPDSLFDAYGQFLGTQQGKEAKSLFEQLPTDLSWTEWSQMRKDKGLSPDQGVTSWKVYKTNIRQSGQGYFGSGYKVIDLYESF